jgi:hypothetical protein
MKMQYLISSPPNPKLDKLLAYAKELGIEVYPFTEEVIDKKKIFASLRVNLSEEANQYIDKELQSIHEAWEKDIS